MPVAPLWRIAAFLATIGATCVLFVVSEPKPPPQRGPAPDLAALIPDQFSGWKQVATDDLTPFQATLGTNTLIQRNYFRDTPRGRDQITIYVAYWAAGQSNPSQVALHTPDGCWPAAGWKRQQAPNNNIILRTQRHTLPEAEYRLFQNEQGQIQHVWYWHMYRGTTIQQLDPYKVSELLQMVLRFGLQAPSDQLFFRISSNREWKDISEEPLLQELFLRFRQFGL